MRKRPKFDYYTMSHDSRYGGVNVYGWGTYEKSSVLAGQPKKVFIDAFETLEAAQAKYPDAALSNKWTEPQVSLSHLPGEDDPVPGGMYPDDIDEGW